MIKEGEGMTTGNSQEGIREEHTRVEAHDRAKQDNKLLQEIKEILIRPLKVPYQQDAAEMMVQGAINQAKEILAKIKRHYEEESEARLELIRRLTARCEQLRDEAKEAKKQERERILAWGMEMCPHWSGEQTREVGVMKRDCSQCWQALKEGAPYATRKSTGDS